ncbi:hypothetical protein [Burkholderia phage BCSR5]|nr:hypothetical protein [Burkholderia phage BCSR5]
MKIQAATRLKAYQLIAKEQVESITVEGLATSLLKKFGGDLTEKKHNGTQLTYGIDIRGEDMRPKIVEFLDRLGLSRVGKMNGIIDVYPRRYVSSRIKIVRLTYESGDVCIEIQGTLDMIQQG